MMKSIYGPNGARLIWNGEWGKARRLYAPLLYTPVKMTDAKLRAWMAQSDRRTYTHKGGKRRIKIAEDERHVTYVTPEYPHSPKQVTAKQWAVWRADAT